MVYRYPDEQTEWMGWKEGPQRKSFINPIWSSASALARHNCSTHGAIKWKPVMLASYPDLMKIKK